jgi:hypothetical protein
VWRFIRRHSSLPGGGDRARENAEINGATIQYDQFMYSAVTMRALDALVAPFGLGYTSLIGSLYDAQVIELLWTRYGDLRDLQYSCWEAGPDGLPCHRCGKCRMVGLCALALGYSPARIGIDLVRLLNGLAEWKRRTPGLFESPLLPRETCKIGYDNQRNTYIQALSTWRLAGRLLRTEPWRLVSRDGWHALHRFSTVKRELAREPTGPKGFRAGFLAHVDPLLRDEVGRIFAERFAPEDDPKQAEMVARCDALTSWITEPLRGRGVDQQRAGSDSPGRSAGWQI